MTGPVRVLIADDHPPTRAGVRMALEHGGCVVCAEASTAADAVSAALAERPDVCLVDLEMPGNGFRAVSGINQHLPDTRILVLTVSRKADDLFDALRAGASGYLLKDMDPEALVQAVRDVVAGEAPLPGFLAARLIDEFRQRGRRTSLTLDQNRRVELTPRESDVLGLFSEGLSTAEIAQRLDLSQVTVRRHISALLRKLGVSSRAEARRLLMENGTGRGGR
jgi:two-component system nitrate/nitrite response regulator NarL